MSLKKILITGSNGQLARSLNFTFSKSLFKIVNVSLNSGHGTNIVSDLSDSKNVSKIIDNFKPDFIINCAAFTNVDLCEEKKEKAYKANVLIVKNLLKYMPKESKLIQVSTDYIFDGLKSPYNEEATPNPLNYYGKTKLEAENLIRSSRKKYIILRTGNIFSEFSDLPSNRLNWILNNLKNNKPILAATDMISKPTHTASIAKLLVEMLSFNQNLIVNYCGQDSLSIYDFSLLVSKVFQFDKNLITPCKISDLPLKARRPQNVSLKTNLISNLIDCNIYETEYSLSIIKNILS